MIVAAVHQAWPPFLLVAGLLLVGQAADRDRLFESLGGRLGRAPLSPTCLLVALLSLVALVTAVLNLDTSVVFLTPVLVHAARRRGLDERPFLYGVVFMSNSASLLLPGSNLTNMLVLDRGSTSGLQFARAMLPSWLAACAVTMAVVARAWRLHPADTVDDELPAFRFGIGAAAVVTAAALVLTLASPAVPVLATGVAAAAAGRIRPRVDPLALGLLFSLSVSLGVVARAWTGPAALLADSSRWATAALAAVSANLLNNLPAATLFSVEPLPHPHALLLGLDLGPNLAVTGSLSAYLWHRAASSVNARPSLVTYSRVGLVLVPLSLGAAVGALSLAR
jgi:arsenical pump membrane protein